MKRTFPLLLIIIFPFFCHSQNQNNSLDREEIRTALVELAVKNYPSLKVNDASIYLAKKNLNFTRTTWTQSLRFFYNVNDQTYNNNVNNTRPVLGAGLSLNLGDFVSLPSKSKMAKAQIMIAENQKDLTEAQIKRDVLTRYNNYLVAKEMLILKNQELEEAQFLHNLMTEKFNKDQITLEDFTRSSIFLSQAKEQQFTAENNMRNARLQVEEYIGKDLEEFLKTYSN